MRKQRSEDIVTCLESHKLEGVESGLNPGSSGHTILYRTIPYYTVPYHTIPYYIILYHTILYHTIPKRLTIVQGAFTTGMPNILCQLNWSMGKPGGYIKHYCWCFCEGDFG